MERSRGGSVESDATASRTARASILAFGRAKLQKNVGKHDPCKTRPVGFGNNEPQEIVGGLKIPPRDSLVCSFWRADENCRGSVLRRSTAIACIRHRGPNASNESQDQARSLHVARVVTAEECLSTRWRVMREALLVSRPAWVCHVARCPSTCRSESDTPVVFASWPCRYLTTIVSTRAYAGPGAANDIDSAKMAATAGKRDGARGKPASVL